MESVISTPALRAAIRFSLTATWESPPINSEALSVSDTGGPPQRNSPVFRKLVEGILYSRRFILSYHVVIFGLLVVFTTVHWAGRLQKWRRRRPKSELRKQKRDHDPKWLPAGSLSMVKSASMTDRETGDTSSSSSSTLQGAGTPPYHGKVGGVDTEETTLLPKQKHERNQARSSVISSVHAWLEYQPRPISVINRTLPSNGTTIAILGFILLNVFYVFYRVPFSIPMLFVFADRASIVFVANLPLLYLLAAKNQPIKFLTGYSYESLNILHRRLGELMCLLALLHSVGMVGVWYTLLRPTGFTFVRFLLSKVILLGLGALLAYELLYVTSLGSFRQRWYELFLGLHIILQAAAVVFLWFHHANSRVYVGIAVAVFLIDRLVYRLNLKTNTVRADIKVLEDEETVALSMVVPFNRKKNFRSIFGCGITSGWKPTEHVFLTVPSLARKHVFQAHPFTIASRAPTSSDTGASIDLIIRAQDGFSADLLQYAKSYKSALVRLDGPYGSQSAVRLLRDSELAVVVAGGSGIAVAWPLVWSLLDTQNSTDLERLSADLPKRVLLIWVVHQRSHFSWIGEERLAALQARGVETILPEPTEEHGRPDLGSIIDSWLRSNRAESHDGTDRIGVVCSGPDGMNRTVRNACASMMAQGRDVGVEIEKFGW